MEDGQLTVVEQTKRTRALPRLLLSYGGAVLAVAVATLLRLWLNPVLHHQAVFTLYYLAVMVIAWHARLGPCLMAIVCSAASSSYFFLDPSFSLAIVGSKYLSELGLFLIVSTFIAFVCEVLHRDVALRREVAMALKQANDQLGQENNTLSHLMELQERERQLIGYEIHDELVQLLTGAKMGMEGLQRMEDRNSAVAKEVLGASVETLRSGINSARKLINNLRPISLDGVGVVEAIKDLTTEVQRTTGCEIVFVSNVRFERLPSSLENNIFRIVQESLNNACRHSTSTRIGVELRQQDDHLRIEVQDWGVGFDSQRVPRDHFGLESIRVRARVFGGQATIKSCPGKGTRVAVELPLPSAGLRGAQQ